MNFRLQVPRITKHEVHIEFIIVDEANGGLSENDAMTLNQGAFLNLQLMVFFFNNQNKAQVSESYHATFIIIGWLP